MDALTIEKGFRKGEVFKNGSSKTERSYFDFVISGKTLGNVLGLPNADLIGTFGWSNQKERENNQVDEFLCLKKSELKTGRIAFYVCPECGDISCGAITGNIEFTDKYVIWKDFGYENDYSEPDLKDYIGIGPFKFSKKEYFNIIKQLKM